MNKSPPWVRKLGRITERCLFCGDDDIKFQISSDPIACTRCIGFDLSDVNTICYNEYLKLRDEEIKKWCLSNNVNYNTVIKE